MREEAVLELVGRCYEAALDPEGWPALAESMTDALGAASGQLVFRDLARPEASRFVPVRLEEHWLATYRTHYVAEDLWLRSGIERGELGKTYRGTDLVPDDELLRHGFYYDFLRPQGIRHCLTAGVAGNRQQAVTVSCFAGPRQEPFGSEAAALFDLLVVHLRRAARLGFALEAANARGRALEEVFERLELGVVLLDPNGRVLLMNRYARELVCARDGLTMQGDELRPARASERSAFAALVAAALAVPTCVGAEPGGALAVTRPSGGRPYALVVTPLAGPVLARGPRAARVAVLMTDPERHAEAPAVALARLLGLTPAEARLARLVALGRSPRQAAEELAITESTARSHLKRVFAKAGVRTQSELVRRIASSAVALARTR